MSRGSLVIDRAMLISLRRFYSLSFLLLVLHLVVVFVAGTFGKLCVY